MSEDVSSQLESDQDKIKEFEDNSKTSKCFKWFLFSVILALVIVVAGVTIGVITT